ncbi:hypothetical protein EDD11_001077 [Mortierella claussenii]|nr:hypothetical protein EDD11_001077 [Mortierella claussenii]
MPSNPVARKTPLADITHRPLTGRRANNTPAQVAVNLACSAGPGEENSPVRGLLEIFAAAQAGSIGRKRSLKLTSDDLDAHPTAPIFLRSVTAKPAKNSTSAGVPSVSASLIKSACKSSHQTVAPAKSRFTLSYNSAHPLNFVSTISRRQTFGRQRNKPSYVSTRFHMLDYISRPNDWQTRPETWLLETRTAQSTLLTLGKTTRIQISVSGDQTARLYDVEAKKCLGTFSGHSGSIKSTSLKFGDDNVFATAARDGTVLIWDVRCSSTTTAQGDTMYRPANKLTNVHASSTRSVPPKKTKHGSDGPNTASAVQFMKHNDNIIASTGALDGSVKYWDVRKHGTYFRHDYPTPLATSIYTPITKRAHGMTSMALSPDGSALFAVSSDNHIYMFNTMVLSSPVERFGGSGFTCSSYYIKISVSPDGNYVAAGSSKDLYVWEINRPDKKPLIFHGHEREVTGVDWAKDLGNGTQLSGCSDDATVRTWRPNRILAEECRENESLKNMHGMVSE